MIYSLDLEQSSSQFAYVADNAPLSITGDFTIEGWFKAESIGIGSQWVGKYNYGAANQCSYGVRIGSDNVLNFYYSADGTGATATTIWTSSAFLTIADVGVWVHFAGAVDVSARTATIWKNGVSVATSGNGTDTSVYDSTASFAIGANYNNGTPANFADGLISDVRLWSDIRTETEIQQNMKRTALTDSGNLAGRWFFDNDYKDVSGNNNTLTSSGSPVFVADSPYQNIGSLLTMFR